MRVEDEACESLLLNSGTEVVGDSCIGGELQVTFIRERADYLGQNLGRDSVHVVMAAS